MKLRKRMFTGAQIPEESERERRHRALAREAAAEGFVLLKNDGLLPLCVEEPVALFGIGAIRTIKGGTGSGEVCQREIVNIRRGMAEAGFYLVSTAWLDEYETLLRREQLRWRDWILSEEKTHDSWDTFNLYAQNPFKMPQARSLRDTDLGDAKKAVYVISRIAGEGVDRRETEGDFRLTAAELEDLRFLGGRGMEIAVLINAGSQVDLSELPEMPGVKAIVFLAQPGMEAGHAVADVLSGKKNFCGKLTDTWTRALEEFPNGNCFSHLSGDVTREEYREDIYVGYRYFDTFGKLPLYCFGYGLSYTNFTVTEPKVNPAGNTVTMTANVTNTGTLAGKEVLQAYAVCPRGELTKEYRRLCGFAKTKELQPGESETVSVTFPVKSLASFHNEKNAWILEKGNYVLELGCSIERAKPAAILRNDQSVVLENTVPVCPLREELETICPDEAALSARVKKLTADAAAAGVPVIAWNPVPEEKKARRVDEIHAFADRLAGELTEEELIALCIGNNGDKGSMLGSAGIFVPGTAGETTRALEATRGVPCISMADGPAGLRLVNRYQVERKSGEVYGNTFFATLENGLLMPEPRTGDYDTYYQYCTAFPVGVLLAQTWDTALLERVGRAVGEEMQEFDVSWWLAPGMNIHRNPLCGRNFEYFSEDPVVSGCCAAAITGGVQSVPGVGTTIKHFACNNQEDNRTGCNSILTERALREIYLRGFEIAVKDAQPMCIMTSYNLINGVHTANSYDLCTELARKEWGFKGVIMTDWSTTANGSTAWKCISSGNDLIMPGERADMDDLRSALSAGAIGLEELRSCAARLLNVILRTTGCDDSVPYGTGE